MIHDLLLAVGYFTRIPVPAHPAFSEQALKRAAVYFPAVGLLIGVVLASVCGLLLQFWSIPIAVLLTLAFGFMLTGGFHEDGWADTFDGFGGAFESEKKLAIMTDSRLGTYGSLALFSLLAIKTVALIELIDIQGVWVLVLVHPLSRWCAMSAMVVLSYAKSGQSKAKPVVQELSAARWLLSGLAVIPGLLWFTPITLLALALSALVLTLFWLWLCKRQIGGYTGDTLGAGQQWVEAGLLLSWLTL